MERLEPELKQIVKRSTTQIADHAYQRGENLAQESQSRYRKEVGRMREGQCQRPMKQWSKLENNNKYDFRGEKERGTICSRSDTKKELQAI